MANLTAQDALALRVFLEARVRAHGIEALVADDTCQAFLFYAAHFLGQRAERLIWPPILASVGVSVTEQSRYPLLYDALERNLGRLGRRLQRSSGERRFLGTLLREAGLPTVIGDLGTRVRAKLTELGWDAASNETLCNCIALEIAQEAGGALRSVLDGEDGVAALAAFLGDAYDVRFTLISRGVDPSTLRSSDEVGRELLRLGIEPPSVRSEQLLADVLAAFLVPSVAPKIPRAPLRIVARRNAAGARVLIHVDLALLDACSELRDLPHVALAAHPSDSPAFFVEREAAGNCFRNARGENAVEWRRRPGAGPTVVDARALDATGTARVVALASTEWPCDPVLWFDSSGELLSEVREVVRVGEEFVLLAQAGSEVAGDGDVLVTPLGTAANIPAFAVEVRGPGAVVVRQGRAIERIPCELHGIAVQVFSQQGMPGILTARVHSRLPTLVLPDGVDATLSIIGFRGERLNLGRVRGRLHLGEDPRLSECCGTIRVVLETGTGSKWSGRWVILPRAFAVHADRGVLVVTHGTSTRLEAPNAEIERISGGSRVSARDGIDRLDLQLILSSGEAVTIPFETPRRGVHLRLGDGSTLPLDGSMITERVIMAGACLQLQGGPGTRLQVRTHGSEVLLRASQRTSHAVYVGLDAILAAQRQEKIFRLPLVADVEGDIQDEVSFTVVIPRRCGPLYRVEGDSLVLEFEVDPEDLPVDPAVAMFLGTTPFDDPALISCALEVKGHRATVVIGSERLPSTRGPYSVGLVDRLSQGLRPISGCGKIWIPLGQTQPAAPAGITPLEAALWEGSQSRIGQSLALVPKRPDVVSWIDKFVYGARARRGFGLWLFVLYEAVMGEAPWLLFAAAARMPRDEWIEWFGAWSSEPGFTWLRVRERDAECLAKVFPAHVGDEGRMGILTAAERVRRMPIAMRHLLENALFRGQSSALLASLRQAELVTPSSARLPRDWDCFGLPPPGRGAAWRWIRGVEIDSTQQKLVDDFLDGQLLHGLRHRALQLAHQFRMRWRGDENPFSLHMPTFAMPPWAAEVASRLRAEWEGAREPAGLGNAIMADVCQLDHDTFQAAVLLTAWRDGGSLAPPKLLFDSVLRLERLAPDLLGAWLAAMQYVQRS